MSCNKKKMASSSICPQFHQFPSAEIQIKKRFHATEKKISVVHTKASFAKEGVATIPSSEKRKMTSGEGLRINIASDVTSFISSSAIAPLKVLELLDTNTISWPMIAAVFMERAIIGCRFFTLFAVVGSLIGSILCFAEGCFLVLDAYVVDFHIVSQRLIQGGNVKLIIEAIDMFLVGTAMLTLGMGLYSMFISLRGTTRSSSGVVHKSHHKMHSVCSDVKSMSQAKAKVGHAVVMLLQSGVVEKFNNVPLTSGLDLACFAGALFFSAASLFALSFLHCNKIKKY